MDLARGLSALAVLFGHSAKVFLEDSRLAHSGIEAMGVFVFFLLSGFLISYTALKRYDDPHYGFGNFFIDRFCRIYCAFIPALILVAVLDHFSVQLGLLVPEQQAKTLSHFINVEDRSGFGSFFGNLFMLQYYPLFMGPPATEGADPTFLVEPFGTSIPFWTISIEWWLYMAFGAVTLLYIRNKKWPALWHWPILFFVFFEPFYHFVSGPDQCLSMLWLIGWAVCFLFLNKTMPDSVTRHAKRISWALILAGLFLFYVRYISLAATHGESGLPELQLGVYIACCVFGGLFLFNGQMSIPSFIRKPVTFLANYSYSLYLIHYSALALMFAYIPTTEHNITTFWCAIVTINLVAIVFWYLFERHHRTVAAFLKKRFLPKD